MNEQSRYLGLTIIERLDLAGVRDDFDAAARARNRTEMIRILGRLEVQEPVWSVDMIIANPRRYGY